MRILISFLTVFMAFPLSCLFEPSAGTTSGTSSGGIFGRLVLPNKKPAAGARVVLTSYKIDQVTVMAKPSASGPLEDITDKHGKYAFDKLNSGVYNLRASYVAKGSNDTLVHLEINLMVESNELKNLGVDTLTKPGALKITVYNSSGPLSEAQCYVPGTSYQAITDADGVCVISGISPETYNIAIRSENYTTFEKKGNKVVKNDTTVIDSIVLEADPTKPPPAPKGLKVEYNDDSGIVTLSWNEVKVSDLDGYIIYRNYPDDPEPKLLNEGYLIKNLFYRDTVYKLESDQIQIQLKYRIKAQDKDADKSTFATFPLVKFDAWVNEAPKFLSLRDTTIKENQPLKIVLSAEDPEGDELSYIVNSTLTGDTLLKNIFSWTPDFQDYGSYPIQFIVTDDGIPHPKSDTISIKINVENVNRAPIFTEIPDTTIKSRQALAFNLYAWDEDDDTLTYKMLSGPYGQVLNGSKYNWTPTTGQSGIYLVEFEVSDNGFPNELKDTIQVEISVIGVMEKALFAWWNFNEEFGNILMDLSLNNNNGSIYNANWATGIEGTALSFNGTNSKVVFGNDILIASEQLSVGAWIKIDEYPTNMIGTIIGNQTDESGVHVGFALNISGKNVATRGLAEFTITDGSHYYTIQSNEIIGLNDWHYVQGTYDGESLKFYVDGVLQTKAPVLNGKVATTNPVNIVRTLSNQPLEIGNEKYFGQDRHFQGLIDEVRVYYEAITEDDVISEWEKFKR